MLAVCSTEGISCHFLDIFQHIAARGIRSITAPFNHMRNLKFKAQQTNAFFATVNQMFDGFSQLPTTAQRAVIKSNRWAQFRQHSRKLGGTAEHLIDDGENAFVGWALNFRVRMWLKSFLNVYLLRSARYICPSLHEPIRTRLRGVDDVSSHLLFLCWCREVAQRIDTPLQG